MNKREMDRSVERLLGSLFRSQRITNARLDAGFKAVKLTHAKFGVLKLLMQIGEPIPLGQIAEHLLSVRSNATQLVDRMEADGLVERVYDPQDRRVVMAQITEVGQQLYEAGWQVVKDIEREILAELSSQEREQLTSLLTRLEQLWS